jgi:glucosamine--fructose-6-phosphate aminotransferase (isomerizing)
VAETIADRLTHGDRVELGDIGIDDDTLAKVRRIVILACGTSYHAALVGRYAIEQWARVPVEMDIASEYRYRNPIVGPDDLVIGISQSGETADTLAAMRLARDRGARVIAITNILGSQITRDADGVLYTRAGLEIGVAATKTFVAQVAAIYLLGLKLAELRHTLEPEELQGLVQELKVDPAPDRGAARLVRRAGRGDRSRSVPPGVLPLPGPAHRPSGLPRGCAEAEGDLLHPDRGVRRGRDEARSDRAPRQHAAGRVRGTDSPVLEKVLSNIAEVKARGSEVIAVATEGSGHVAAPPTRRVHPAHRLDPPADPRGDPAAAARVQHRRDLRAERRPAAEPREDRHGRVVPKLSSAAGRS